MHDEIDAMISEYNNVHKIARRQPGRHRKGHSLARNITVGAVTFVAAGMVTAFALGASPAHAATVHHRPPAVKPVNWTKVAKADYQRWLHHETNANMTPLVSAGLHLGGYTRADILQLAADEFSPKRDMSYIDTDVQYVTADLYDGYGM